MASALLALSWELLARQRWVVGLTAAYLLLICTVTPLLPAEWQRSELGWGLTGVLTAGLIFVVGGLSHGAESPLEERAGAFPRHLFLLPVPTWALVLPPVLLSGGVVAGSWALTAVCVLRPCGVAVGVLWPAVLGAATMAWLQALCWLPLPSGWLRAPLAGVVVLAAGAGAIAALDWAAEAEWLYVSIVAALPAGQALAWFAVGQARHGARAAEPAHAAPRREASAGPLAAMTSPARAQLWLEWRLQGPLYLGMAGLCLAMATWVAHVQVMYVEEAVLVEVMPAVRGVVDRFGMAWVAMSHLAVALLFCSAIYGVEAGRLSGHRDGAGVPGVLFTAPQTSADMVRAKFLMAALVQAASWAAAVGMGVVWAGATGHLADMSARLIEETGSPAAALVVFAGAWLALVAVSWLTVTSGMWAGLAGWRAKAGVPMLVQAAFWIGIVFMVRRERLEWLVGLVAAALAGKALLTAAVARRSVGDRLLRGRTVAAALLVWGGAAAALAGAAGAVTGSWLAAGVMILMLPVGRLLLAPLALHQARHG